jgi:hypothetical protein
VTLQPGINHFCFHIFHSAPPLGEDGKQPNVASTTAAASLVDHATASASSTSQHYSLVLYHSFAELEHLHAIFEPSHAHMQQVVERRRRSIVAGSSMKATSASLPSSLHASAAASPTGTSAVHSDWSTKLSLRHICFGVGRLQLWHIDLQTFNATLKTRILTPAQRNLSKTASCISCDTATPI